MEANEKGTMVACTTLGNIEDASTSSTPKESSPSATSTCTTIFWEDNAVSLGEDEDRTRRKGDPGLDLERGRRIDGSIEQLPGNKPNTRHRFTFLWLRLYLQSIRIVNVVWIVLYVTLNVYVFVNKAVVYSHNQRAQNVYGTCIVAARGAAACLNLNCGLILLPVCWNLMTVLSSIRPLKRLLPLQSHRAAHMLIGSSIIMFTCVHVGAHICDAVRFSHAPDDELHALFGAKLGTNIPPNPADRWKFLMMSTPGATGILMLILMALAVPMIAVRRTNYRRFWSYHHLLLLLLVVLCVHGTANLLEPSQSVAWILCPLLIYLLFRIVREIRTFTRATLIQAKIKSGKIVQLRLHKPRGWGTHVHKAGMIVHVKVPELSHFEWHPFSLTSIPSDDFVELHIKVNGTWTSRLHDAVRSSPVEAEDESHAAMLEEGGSDVRRISLGSSTATVQPIPATTTIHPGLTFLLDGPIHSVISHGYANDGQAMLVIGAGIGITPMISILKQRVGEGRNCLKAVYVIWVVRDYETLHCFSNDIEHMMQTVASLPLNNHGHVRFFVTRRPSPESQSSARVPKQIHKTTRFGRPEWCKELSDVRAMVLAQGMSLCQALVCGSELMAEEVRQEAESMSDDEFRFACASETFVVSQP